MAEVEEQKNKFKYKKQVGWSLICLSLVLLIFSTFEFVYPIKQFLLGAFGIMLYPLLVFTTIFSLGLVSKRKFVYSFRYVLYLFLCFFFLMCVIHSVVTGFTGKELSYGEYLSSCYNTMYTPGGVLIGVFTYPVSALLHDIASIVIYSIAFIISLYFVISYLDSIKAKKQPIPVTVERYQNFNTITNDLESLDQTEEGSDDDAYQEETEEEVETPEVLEENSEEDIFIPDENQEESPEVKKAKETLFGGITLTQKNVALEEDNSPATKLFDNNQDGWTNRGVKDDAPPKFTYGKDGEEKPKKDDTKYQQTKEYLKTLFEPNYDSRNEIINAESYDDYQTKMQLYKQQHSQPIKREYELTVNQTLQPTLKVSEEKKQQPQDNMPNLNTNSFGGNSNNFGSTFNGSFSTNNFGNNFNQNNGFTRPNNLGNNNTNNFNTNNNQVNTSRAMGANNFNMDFGIEPNVVKNNYQPKPTNSFNPFIEEDKNDLGLSSSDFEDINSIVNSTIEGINDDYIKPVNPFEQKVSPLNPANFDLSQQKYGEMEKPAEDLTQKFVEKTEINAPTPFDTTKLSDGDVATSIGKSYNLPKSLMAANNSAAESAANAPTPGELAKANEPNFGFTAKYIRPPIDLLKDYHNDNSEENTQHNIMVLEQVLEQFGIPAKVLAVRRGAAFTRYELNPPPGISVRKIHAHASDIALALAAKGDIRIETPIKGKSAVGIEVPNEKVDTVGLKKIIASDEFRNKKSPLNFALGEDVDGNVYTCNLDKMPHLLVAGSTGSGKSVCLNTLLISLIYRTSPEDLRIILVDPKRVEFGIYNNLPHLLLPKAITEPKKALNAFDWLINEMERRFIVFQDCYVKNITEYNNQPEVQSRQLQKMPYIVLIVDELADLVVTTNKKELEEKIIRLTQKARAAGIHLILATQRPSVDIITGTIKINLPARIAFAVSQFVDSKTILDQGGAEKLLGRGDMLYSPSDGEPTRVQGAFVDTPEVREVVEFVKANNKAVYDDKIQRIINSENGPAGANGNPATVGASANEEFDTLMPDALKLVIENGQASISMLQRRFSIGFSRAARIIDQMQLAKFISSSDGSKPRNVFITMEEYNQIYGNR